MLLAGLLAVSKLRRSPTLLNFAKAATPRVQNCWERVDSNGNRKRRERLLASALPCSQAPFLCAAFSTLASRVAVQEWKLTST